MILLSELVPVGKVTQKVNVVINIDKTQHAGERQYRHGDFVFTDDDILAITNLALPEISKRLMLGALVAGDSILIRHRDLNVVGSLQNKNNMLEFVVITLMKKENFVPKPGTKIIEI